MSRIDEALKLLEEANGTVVSEITAVQAGRISPFIQYEREDPNQRAHDKPTAPREKPTAPRSDEPSERTSRRASIARPVSMRRLKLPDDAELQARLVCDTANTVSLEQYRRLGAVLHEAQAQKQSKTVMITSALPHEGKTLTVVNLALTLSESYGRRVLMIDADLRWPSLHTVLDIPNDQGLSEALQDDQHELPITEVSGRLSALTGGKPGPTPLIGLSSKRMAEVLEECAARFDWVLIDTPPVGVLPDAQVLTRLVGEVILVIGAGSTPAAAIERAVAELGGPDAISGTVLNRVEEHRIPDAGYYSQYGTSRKRD
jgi:capsular exopolysaccharide synthesis family protein